jgi:hypothetical protein
VSFVCAQARGLGEEKRSGRVKALTLLMRLTLKGSNALMRLTLHAFKRSGRLRSADP